MAIKFDHAVKYHGKWYAAGEAIEEPRVEEKSEAKPEPAQKTVKSRKKASGDAE